MKSSNFVFDCVYFWLHYINFHKISKSKLSRVRSYIDSRDLIRNRRATIKPKNNGDKCFKYTATLPLNHEEIGEKKGKE